MIKCPHCTGGRIAVEPGSSLAYACPDCHGSGYLDDPVEDERDCDDGEEEEDDESL